MGIETHVVCGTPEPGEGDLADSLIEDGFQVHSIAELGRDVSLRRDARALRALGRLLARVRPDVVHTHQAKAGALGRVAASRAAIPAVFHTFHGHVFEGYFSPWRSKLWIAVERWLARRTDRLLVPGDSLRNDLLRFRIAPPEAFVPYDQPVDWDAFDEDRAGDEPAVREAIRWARDSRKGDPQRCVLGIVGRLAPIKEHGLLFDALEEVVTSHDVRLLIFGDGPLRESLESDARRRGLDEIVRFVGAVSNGPSLYASLDGLVCCSRNEGVPLCVIEALACGTRVIVTDVGGMRDAIADAEPSRVSVIAKGDSEALAGAISRIRPDALEPTGEIDDDSQRVRDRHDPQRVSLQLAKLYEEVLRGKRRERKHSVPRERTVVSSGERQDGSGEPRG